MQAERRASIVRGVRSVINRIDVRTESRAPEELAAAVNAALESDPATHAYEVQVSAAADGKITLTGAVDSHAERDLVENAAMTVAGVTGIDDQLRIEPVPAIAISAELGPQIAALLQWDARVDESLIRVRVLDGARVMLSGTVGSLAEKQLAERLAWLPGVQSVDASHLEVEPWARDPDQQLGEQPLPPRMDVREALTRALELDPRVRSAPIEVAVDGSTVLLRGTVDNLLSKRAAERDALNTTGVESVRNHLRVRGAAQSDNAIRIAIERQLAQAGLDDGGIEVSVRDAEVRLVGDVGSTADYRNAERVASIAPGVEDLRNDLTVRGAKPMTSSVGFYPNMLEARGVPTASDRKIYDDLRTELFWSPFVDADQVTVEVDDGVVTLTGDVDSVREKRAAADNAYQAGAVIVRNELTTQ
jgi:osmotically-inducible protein OsmY